jgi:integrase
MEYRKLTKYPGVYERTSDIRMHKSKPDICYDIAYKHDGKKIWEKVGWLSEGYSAKLAAEVRAERLRTMRHGEELPRQRKKHIYFKELAQRYLKWAEDNKKSAFTDKHRYENHLASRFDDKRINEITSLDLERMKSELSKEGLAPATVKHCLVLFRQMINKAIIWKLYQDANPVKGVKLPTLQNQRERFLSYEEAQRLLEILYEMDRQIYDMALISFHTGMRAGEILNLRGQDINLVHGFIHIADAKTGHPRKAYMTDAVKEVLLKYSVAADEYIFKSRSGDRYTEVPRNFKKVVDPLFNKNVKDTRQRVTFHSLRHTFGSWLALQGESLITIRELLGHKSFAMTQRYTHLMPDQKRRATLNLETAFNTKQQHNELKAIT